MNKKILSFLIILLVSVKVFSQDPNFHIYLCFGQSNSEGQGAIEMQDKTVDPRFQVMSAVDCSNLGRTKGSWYTAVPPLGRCYTGLCPTDYFGRTMVENLPDSIRVGVINVSVAGCKIELFQKEAYESYVASITEDWLRNIISAYDGNPYSYMLDLAKQAQNDGVIKGFLLHQGESNTGDSQWPAKVKSIYDNLITDLGLDASTPILAGEVVHADQGGICSSMNAIINKLPQTIPSAYVISSSGCTDGADNLHFNSAGYRKLGTRYAIQMLSLMGIEIEEPEDPQVEGTELVCLEPECASTIGENWEVIEDAAASNGNYVEVKAGVQSLQAAAGAEGEIVLPFTLTDAGTFNVYARLNCPTADDDSYWVKVDNNAYVMCNGLATAGWEWKNLATFELAAGDHTLSITYREDGAKLDKLCVSNYSTAPTGMGDAAVNLCEAETPGVGVKYIEANNGYTLNKNYPNPVNGKTTISFTIPKAGFVSLKVYDIRGVEMTELAGKEFESGEHAIEFDAGKLSSGLYFYTLKSGSYSASEKMIVTER